MTEIDVNQTSSETVDSPKMVTVNGQYTFRIGETFPSYEELEKRLELHCAESFVYYWRRDTRTVKGAHTKTSRPIASKLKYYSLRYACVFGGEKKKSRSQGKRHNSKTLRNDCPSFIMLRASKDGSHLEVVGVNNEHNHDCSNIVNQHLPHRRKLPEDLKQEVVEMMMLHIDRKKIIEYVKRKADKSVTVKDLFNLKAKYKGFNFKLERTKDEILQSMGLSTSSDEMIDNDESVEDESKRWMEVCYNENVIEYDKYGDYQDDAQGEGDVEVHSSNFLVYSDGVECDDRNETKYQIIDDADVQDYQLEEEEVYAITIDEEQKFVARISTEEQATISSSPPNTGVDPSERKQQSRNLRALRLKSLMQRENNRLNRKLTNCRICGTNRRFLDRQIQQLRAEKRKLLEETSQLRRTKEKLLDQVAFIESNLIVE